MFDGSPLNRIAAASLTADDLRDYQEAAAQWLLENPFSALWADMGMGKCVISLRVLHTLWSEFRFNRVLICAPMRVAVHTWPSELALWSFAAGMSHTVIRTELQDHPEMEAEIADARSQMRAKGVTAAESNRRSAWLRTQLQRHEKWKLAQRPTAIHIINHDAIPWLVQVFGRDKWPYDAVIIDESTAVKNHATERFKALSYVRPVIQRLHELTATPAPQGLDGLFSQMYLLDRGERFGKNITAFRKRYLMPKPYVPHQWIMQPGADEKIASKIHDIVHTIKADDHFPPRKPVLLSREFNLSRSEQATYDKLEREKILELPDGREILPREAGAVYQKLTQIASGMVYDETGATHWYHDHKIAELEELIEEAQGQPVLVAHWHKITLKRLKEAFPQGRAVDKQGKIIDEWNAGKVPLMFVQPASDAWGLNLHLGGAHILVFFDLIHSFGLWFQLIGRLRPTTNKHIVQVYHLVAKGTIDEDIMANRENREAMQTALYARVKRLQQKESEHGRV